MEVKIFIYDKWKKMEKTYESLSKGVLSPKQTRLVPKCMIPTTCLLPQIILTKLTHILTNLTPHLSRRLLANKIAKLS